MALATEVPHGSEVATVPLVASTQPDGEDGLDLGEFLSMVGSDATGRSEEADGFDSCVSLELARVDMIAETGDSWEPDALTGHVRF